MKTLPFFVCLVVFALVSTLVNSANAQSNDTADSWDWPLKPWGDFKIAQNFGPATFPSKENDYHPGVDIWKKSGETKYLPVFAAANGVVSYLCNSATETTDCQGFGKAVLVSHTLPDGSKFTSFYGHLQVGSNMPIVRKGTEVKKGETIIGYIADQEHCGDICNGPHLHVGIRKGHFAESGFPSSQWGYFPLTNSSEFAQWQEPVGFIESRLHPKTSPPPTNPVAQNPQGDWLRQIETYIQETQDNVEAQMKQWIEQSQRSIERQIYDWGKSLEKSVNEWLAKQQRELERTAEKAVNEFVQQACGTQAIILAFVIGVIFFHRQRQ